MVRWAWHVTFVVEPSLPKIEPIYQDMSSEVTCLTRGSTWIGIVVIIVKYQYHQEFVEIYSLVLKLYSFLKISRSYVLSYQLYKTQSKQEVFYWESFFWLILLFSKISFSCHLESTQKTTEAERKAFFRSGKSLFTSL